MKIKKLVLGPLETNCYILEEKNEAVIIDPAAEPEKIFSSLSTPNLTYIICTHAHPDHLGALSALKNEFPKAKFLIHKAELPILKNALLVSRFFLGYRVEIPPKPDGFLKDGQEIPLLTSHFPFLSVIHTPGHSPGGICLKVKNFLFTGDTLFANGVGRTDFPYSNRKDLIKSLKKLAKLPKNLIIYPGHGESSTLGQAPEQLPMPLGEF